MKITCIYGGHQQAKARKRMNQLSVAGKLWSDDDFHCLKMDEFCGDLASSLDKDAKMRARKPFWNWREQWEIPLRAFLQVGVFYSMTNSRISMLVLCCFMLAWLTLFMMLFLTRKEETIDIFSCVSILYLSRCWFPKLDKLHTWFKIARKFKMVRLCETR